MATASLVPASRALIGSHWLPSLAFFIGLHHWPPLLASLVGSPCWLPPSLLPLHLPHLTHLFVPRLQDSHLPSLGFSLAILLLPLASSLVGPSSSPSSGILVESRRELVRPSASPPQTSTCKWRDGSCVCKGGCKGGFIVCNWCKPSRLAKLPRGRGLWGYPLD
ncbi:hypothetical protein F4778DRAFT_739978 [Xylariomycetidae sp. FL2044]|nr:hypothetical protein F4778DRAFT_739978 [Xylariomycetidae sp. FL2044]